MKVDLTFTITAILALCGVIAPSITTILNNRHSYKMRKLELAESRAEKMVFYERGVYEDYIRHTLGCLYTPNNENLAKYGEVYALAMLYFPADIHPELIRINDCIAKSNYPDALDLLNTFVPQLRDYVVLQPSALSALSKKKQKR